MPHVPAAFATPLTADPDRTGMWGTHVMTANPDVTAAVPAMVATDPDPIAMRAGRSGNDFDGTRWRRSDANDDLCVCGTGREKDSGSSEE
jgi:hypothetical protein